MASEIRVGVSLAVKGTELDFRSSPTSFNADQALTNKGHGPGRVIATTAGKDVDLSAFTQPGVMWLQNLDSVNIVTAGVWDPVALKFYPLIELQPGEFYVLRLSRYLKEYYGTGTGTILTDTDPDNVRLRLKSDNANVECQVEVFES